MSSVTEPEETVRLTLTVPKVVAMHLREQMSYGGYASESEYVESILLSDTLAHPAHERELDQWIQSEGVRRLQALKADPQRALSHEAFWSQVEADEKSQFDERTPGEAA